ncbi:hypothetical protein SUDANB95_01047 [Actinosynnema sp. ALI-1.44]
MDGYGISVDFDGHRLVVRTKNVIAKAALGTAGLDVASDDITSLALKNAGLIRSGRLELTTHTGNRYQLHFTRPQQADFALLHERLVAAGAGTARTTGPAPQRHDLPIAPPQSGPPQSGPPQSAPPPSAPAAPPPSAPAAPPPSAPVAPPRPAPVSPPKPATEPVVLRGSGWFGQEVVGESHYTKALQRLAGKTRTGERETPAELRPEPNNRHDRNAVQVVVEGHVVGYLPREAAAEYHRPLRQVGRPASCRARLWWSRERGDFRASVSLDLAEAALLFPVNAVDTGRRHVVVPPGRKFQLAKENEHLDVLAPLIERGLAPGRALVVAALRVVERIGPRSTSQVVEVLVDDRLIGELSKQTSTRLAPLVRPLQEAGVTCYADVLLSGNAFAVEARLHIAPPDELPHDFVARVQRELNAG